MTYIVNNNFSIVCYYWQSGAFINGYHDNFVQALNDLINQYGPPHKVEASVLNDS